jgi:hypothetical protein
LMHSLASGSASCASLKISGKAVSHKLQVSSSPGASMISLQVCRQKLRRQQCVPVNAVHIKSRRKLGAAAWVQQDSIQECLVQAAGGCRRAHHCKQRTAGGAN